MELFELFLVFAQIGFTSFGGLSMVPVINEQMIAHGWMDAQEVINIIAIAEMTPGPLGINCATFAGTRVAGMLGGVIAVLGVLMPVFTTTFAVSIFYEKFKQTQVVSSMLHVIRPVCIGMIAAIAIGLIPETYMQLGTYHLLWKNTMLGGVCLVLLWRKKSVPSVILFAALCGALFLG